MPHKNLAQVVYGALRAEVERLMPLLDDPRTEVREAATAALGRTGSFEALPALIRLLHDPERRVRSGAAGALGEIGSPDAVPALVEQLDDQDAGVREAAAQALGEIGSETAVAGLLRCLEDPSGHVRLMAIEALGRIGSPEALPALEKCAKGDDESMKRCAVEAAELIRSPRPELPEIASEDQQLPVLANHPPLARFAEGVHAGWRPEERVHVSGCQFCQRLVAVEWSIRHPEVLTLSAYAADPEAFPDVRAMRQHLTDGCPRCVLLLRTAVITALAALIRVGKKLELTALGLRAGLPQLQHLAPSQAETYAYEAAHGSSLTLHEGYGHELLVSVGLSEAIAPTGVRLEIIGEHGSRAEDMRSAEYRLGGTSEARQEFGEDLVVLAASASGESLAELAAWLADPSTEVQRAAAQVAGALGAAAATTEVLVRLTELLRDENEQVRKAAQDALLHCRTIA